MMKMLKKADAQKMVEMQTEGHATPVRALKIRRMPWAMGFIPEFEPLKVHVVSMEELKQDLRGEPRDYAPGEREAVSRIPEEVAQGMQNARKERWKQRLMTMLFVVMSVIWVMFYVNGIDWATDLIVLSVTRYALRSVLAMWIIPGKLLCAAVAIALMFYVYPRFHGRNEPNYVSHDRSYSQEIAVMLCALVIAWLTVLAIEHFDAKSGVLTMLDMMLTVNLTAFVLGMLSWYVYCFMVSMLFANRTVKHI